MYDDGEESEKNKIQKMMEEMAAIKKADQQQFDSIQYRRNKKNIKIKQDDLIAQLPPPKSKQEVYQEMKAKQKNSWKSPGYVNEEFSKIPVLRGKVLTEWEYERIFLSERSYKAPAGYKGFKCKSHGDEFGETKMEQYPPSYQEYLKQFKLKYDDFTHRPSKYGKINLDQRLENLTLMNKEPFRLTNSVQQNEFGFDKHSTWEFEITNKLKKSDTLPQIQSRTLRNKQQSSQYQQQSTYN